MAKAQYRIDQWTADDGLPQNSVYGIAQTGDGYLWMATVDGLARFDGVRFTVFNKSNSPGIVNNRFTSLFEAADGDLWAGTEESGATRYHQGRFTSYGAESGLSSLEVYFISGDADGNPLFVVGNHQIYHFSDEKFSVSNEEPASLQTAPIAKPESLNCYYPPGNEQVNCLGNGQFVKFTLADGLPSLNIIGVARDIDETFWLLTSDAGLVHLKTGEAAKIYTKQDGLPEIPLGLVFGARLNLLSKDKQGALWLTDVRTMRNELLSRNPPPPLMEPRAGFTNITAIWSAQEDREGNLWIGTLRDGLFRVRKQAVTVYSKADGLSDNNVYPIFEDRQGVVWIGTTKGVFKYQNSGFTLVKSSAGFYVDAFGEDASGRLLVSTFGSLYVLDKEQLKQFYKSESGVIWAIHTDRENALWIGSQHGLARLKDNIKTTFTTADGLAANHIKVIIDDKNGGVWIGSYGGLTHFNNGKFEKWTESEGLPTPTIRSLYLDSDNTLWIGSYDSGMARFKDGKFTHYNTKNGLYNDGAFQILEDERQNFWISSNRGIYRVNKNELNEFAEGKRGSITSVGYGKSDGMLSVEANGGRMPGGIRASDGRLWFPTQDGVAVINPETVKINPQPPPVIIEDIKIDNQSINVETNKSEIRNSKSQIQIEPNQQNFEIQYTALSFINSENLRFKYKLEGLDSNWIDAATRRTAYFSHVPPGEYTFTVIAANSDGIWNEQGASVNITILPRFHQTWQFIVLSVLAIAAAAYFLFKRRLSRVESQRLAQQNFSRQLIASQEQERKRIAGELHDGLGQTLAMIRNRAILGSEDLNDLNLAEEQFAIITEQTGQAIGEVREIAYNLRPYLLDRLGLTKALHSLVLKTAETGKIKLTEKIDELDNLLPPDSEISVYRIVQECLSNILKHAEANELAVVIKKRETHLQIQIVDDGKGFDPNAPIKKDGGGFGLLSLNERIRMLGGSFKIESEIGKGTKIDIIIEIVN